MHATQVHHELSVPAVSLMLAAIASYVVLQCCKLFLEEKERALSSSSSHAATSASSSGAGSSGGSASHASGRGGASSVVSAGSGSSSKMLGLRAAAALGSVVMYTLVRRVGLGSVQQIAVWGCPWLLSCSSALFCVFETCRAPQQINNCAALL